MSKLTTRHRKNYTKRGGGITPANPEWCAEAIRIMEATDAGIQCSKPPGHGPEGVYCKRHAERFKHQGGSK